MRGWWAAGVVGLCLVLLPSALLADETGPEVALARSCFESAGGPDPCQTVFGWCDPVWGYARRERCAEAIAEAWIKVLDSYWSELEPIVVAFDAANNRDNQPALWEAMLREQSAWIKFRDASCSIDLTAEYIVSGPEEDRALCQAELTRARVAQVYARLGWMRDYVGEQGKSAP